MRKHYRLGTGKLRRAVDPVTVANKKAFLVRELEARQAQQAKEKITGAVLSKLMKRNLSALVVITAGAGYVMSAGPLFSLGTFTGVLLGTSLTAGSAAAFNQIFERKYDAQMQRTQNRPLVTGALSVKTAYRIAYASAITGVGSLYVTTTPMTAALGLVTLLMYTHIYTPMKRTSIYNTEVGAIVGAIPPIMGWTAALNTTGVFSSEAFLLAATLFSWQMHHFMTIAWLRRNDYKNAGFKMMSWDDADGFKTAGKGLFWAGSMTLLPFIAYMGNITASPCVAGTAGVNLLLLGFYANFYQQRTSKSARRAMLAGILQLMITFVLMASFMSKHEGSGGFLATLMDIPPTLFSAYRSQDVLSQDNHMRLREYVSREATDPQQQNDNEEVTEETVQEAAK
jgi:protoheme IX farnesyltransferase